MRKMIAAALATSLSYSAPTPAAEPTVPWRVDWRDDICSLLLGSTHLPGASVSVKVIPGAERTMINAAHPAWKRSPAHRPSHVRLELDSREEKPTGIYFYGKDLADGPTLLLVMEGRSFLDRLSTAKSLSIREDGRSIATTELPLARDAVAAIRQCEQDALQQWGVDTKAWATLRSGPLPAADIASYVTSNDYPAEAARAEIAGTTIIRLSVDASGTPVECAFAVKSGSDALDNRSCAVFLSRARFQPAIDAQGHPVPAPYVAKIKWSLGQ